ncbi:aminotransferase [Carnobacterium divergens]|uniref:Aminotransferase n=1 Tax=Carnobacterium divergens TaxID=2748 RepID=A0A7Z8CYZ9_CARDV|nr:aminotransferase [Carnobacterium divergens]TFI72312.1 aminotransferase [Carnobacterium divergens]TFI76859.1 aminotransferase [Carnobacterium divergens]TFI83042.1 aminotransferase [Carnobacterium divergens]TFI95031.1 aminotransferase [Carnobacterium divergens]TFJ11563.1 aminotransferase [Carnobacterium divergens]
MNIAPFGVEEWLNEWENEAIYDIAGSSIASLTVEELIGLDGSTIEAFFKEQSKTTLNYGWIEGSPEFKEEVSQLYTTVSPEAILQTNGATGANLLALYALVEAGDHVIALHPSYQQLYDIPKSLGATVDYWSIYESNQWLPRIEELKKLIQPNTKLICLNNANNPTGTLLDEAFLKEIVLLARKVDAYILVDEVYQCLDSTQTIPSIVDLYEKGIATNSLSKTYSLPGLRVGWTASSKEIADLFRKYRDYTMICSGVLDDALAVHALKNKAMILERNRAIVATNLAILTDWVQKEPRVSLILPKSVSTSFIKLDIPIDVEEFCLRLLKEKGVLLVPGTRFETPFHARLGFCAPTDTLVAGLRELSLFLRSFDN